MTPRRARVALCAIVGVYVVCGAAFIQRTSFATPEGRVYCLWDDAMISMHYARNLAEGRGLVWNAGEEPVQGISNPGVALVMAGIHLLPVDERFVSLVFQVLNLVVLSLVLVVTFALAGVLVPGRFDIAIGAVLATALAGPLALWSLRGSDMGLVTLWLLIGVYGVALAEAGRPIRLAWLLALLCPGLLIRPDCALFFGLLLLATMLLPNGWRAGLVGAAVAAAFLGGWMLLGVLYYGDALPNTYYLKATGHPRMSVLAKGVELLGWWLPYLLLPLGFAAAALWAGRATIAYRLCAAIIGVSIAYTVWVGGDWMATHGIRYMVPMLPLLSILMVVGATQWADRFVPEALRGAGRFAFVTVGMAFVLGVVANPPAARAEWLGGKEPLLLSYNRTNYYFALYIARSTDPSTSIGVQWAGAPIYFSRRPGVDLLGKSDRHIARLAVDRFEPGHSKWDWDYVVTVARPDILADHTQELASRADFRRAYVRVEKGDRYFYMRRSSLPKLRDRSVELIDLTTGRRTTRSEVATAQK